VLQRRKKPNRYKKNSEKARLLVKKRTRYCETVRGRVPAENQVHFTEHLSILFLE
jgi:hypothetical protein